MGDNQMTPPWELDLVVVGTPKAGSTTLHHYLAQHSGLALTQPKEPHFFDVNYEEPVTEHLAPWFSHAEPTQLRGEVTPHYLFLPYVAERLRNHAPEATLVAVLRDPVDRAYSDWWMYWTRATEPLPFEDAIRANLERLDSGPMFTEGDAEKRWQTYYEETLSGSPTEIQQRPYVEIGHYAEQIQRYLDYFEADQIHVFLAAELREDPARIVRKVWRELELDPCVTLGPPERRNEAMGGITRYLYAAGRSLGIKPLFHVLPRGIRTKLKQLTARVDERPPMPETVRERLAEHYEPHNRRLEKLIDRDLSHWTRP